MGVRYLQTFVKTHVPNAFFPINIFDEIKEYKSNNPGKPVVIVFDLLNFLHGVYEGFDRIERFCGGNYKKLHSVFERFFSELTNAGAKLVFFKDGSVQDSKFDTWCNRRNKDYVDFCQLFDLVDSNVSLNQIANVDHKTINFSPSMSAAIFDLVILCQKYGEYRLAVNSECDTEVAKYAKEQNVLSVFGNDTDYMIYEGEWRYWSLKDIDFITPQWRTFEYNRKALKTCLNLSSRQMILFSMLCGNDVIQFRSLKHFHKNIRIICQNDSNNDANYDYRKHFFLEIARYVEKFSENPTAEEIETLCMDVFGSKIYKNIQLIHEGLKFYDTTVEPAIIDPLLQRAAAYHSRLYIILAGLPISFSLPLCDLRRTDFLPFHQIIFPLLARQVGLIKQNSDDVSTYRQVVETKLSHDETYTFINLIPEYPPFTLPSLMELIFQEDNRRFQRLRFVLLKWLIFDDIYSEMDIEEIPKGYMMTVLTIKYLLKLHQITSIEADAFLLTAYQVNEDIEGPNVPPSHIQSRTIIITQFYLYVYNQIRTCFSFVGMKKFIETLTFDGIRFVNLLNSLKNMAEDSQSYNDAIEDIRFYKSLFK